MDLFTLALAKKSAGANKNIIYYSIDITELVENNAAYIIVKSTQDIQDYITKYRVSVGITFVPVVFEDGVQYKIVEAPFDFIYVNGAIWNNAHQFKRVGVISPVITQQFGLDEILWFDTTIPKIMGYFGMDEGSYNLTFCDTSKHSYPEGKIAIIFTVDSTDSFVANKAEGLWDLILSNPETRLIFEYENQENIPVIDAPFVYSATPAIDIEEV